VRTAALTALAVSALVWAGCGQQHQQFQQQADTAASRTVTAGTTSDAALPRAHPQAIEPVAGKASPVVSADSAPAQVSVGSGGGSVTLPQPVSDAVVRQELAASGLSANAQQATLTPAGLAIAPANAPWAVQEVIAAGNEIAHLPYRFGGGHGTFEDNAYDCSGSLSFVFAAAGLLNTTVTSGQLMSWGKPGRGKWITVFAAPGHTFMYVAGLRFDTVALAETGSRWSNRSADESNLSSFVVRHPAGL
jgi:cell wall-associated NlpC family hydrolase